VASPKRAATLLGFRARVLLSEGLADLVRAKGSASRWR
jgi:hypothetical protein